MRYLSSDINYSYSSFGNKTIGKQLYGTFTRPTVETREATLVDRDVFELYYLTCILFFPRSIFERFLQRPYIHEHIQMHVAVSYSFT